MAQTSKGAEVACMIGIGHPADNAEYPTQTYPALADCVHWNEW